VVQLNGAVAIGLAEGPQRGLALIDEFGASGSSIDTTCFMLPAPRWCAGAARSRRRQTRIGALALIANGVERAYLKRRLAAL